MPPAPTLAEVVGAVMAGLAEARSLGDRLSRDLADLYERDNLMRAFPVPRMEYANVEIDLPFAVRSVGGSRGPGYDLLREEGARLAAKARESVASERLTAAALDAATKAATAEATEALLLADLRESQPTAEQSNLTATRIAQAFVDALSVRNRERRTALMTLVRTEVNPVVKEALQTLAAARVGGGAPPAVSVFVTSTELANVPEGTIARVKITANTRNYEWTMVDQKNGEPVHKLVPE